MICQPNSCYYGIKTSPMSALGYGFADMSVFVLLSTQHIVNLVSYNLSFLPLVDLVLSLRCNLFDYTWFIPDWYKRLTFQVRSINVAKLTQTIDGGSLAV